MGNTAFISYSHKDEGFARRFHRQLENWKVPSDLVGRETQNGIVPDTLRPIFRDRDDFAGGSSLENATIQALKESKFLIVLCSPDAAKSENVIEEVRLFKAMGRTNKIIPVIIAGKPNDPDNECFPSSIKFKVDNDGTILTEEAAPIAADARDVGDGKKRAFLKVVAGLLGLSFDDLFQRAEHARRNRNAVLIGIAIGAFVFATAFASFALYQNYQSKITIEKSVFAIGGLIRKTDGLDSGYVEQARSEMLRVECDLIEGLSHESNQIGLIEKTICFSEQARTIYENGEKDASIRGLSDWLALRQNEFDKAPSPSFHQAISLVKTGRELTNLQIKITGSNDRNIEILSNLVKITDKAGRKCPDIDYIRVVNDEAVWKLIDALEQGGKYKDSLELMQQAANLRKMQAEAEQSNSALFDQGVFLRRIAWMLGDRMNENSQALETALQAVAVFETLSQKSGPSLDLNYEKGLTYQLVGERYYMTGDTNNARTAYMDAMANLKKVRDDKEASNELKDEVAGPINYLTEKLDTLD